MNPLFTAHLNRIHDKFSDTFALDNLAAYVTKHIRLDGRKWLFGSNYAFQKDVLNDTSRVVNVQKPAQIGLTMVSMAWGLAACATQERFNVIYALPSATDANKLVVTKMNPLIQESPELKRLVSSDVDNTSLKQIGNNFLHIRGTQSETSALSVSADALVVDEVDRCDQFRVKQFRSRLQASEHKIIRQFSTPTVEGHGIAKEGTTARRMRHFAKCACCGHRWLPTYAENLIIPRYDRPLIELTRLNIKDVAWQQAQWLCPNCKRDPQLCVENLEWVCENPNDNYEAVQYYITPVTAHKVLTPDYLVASSTEYEQRSEWMNQVLGETAESAELTLTASDIKTAMVYMSLDSSSPHVMGVDIGQRCAVTIGRQDADGTVLVVHREFVPLNLLKVRRKELILKYNIVLSVHDTLPETNLIREITEEDQNAYGCIFTKASSGGLFTLQEREEDLAEGKLNLRQLKTDRTASLDYVLELFKSRKLMIRDVATDYTAQYLSLKRIQELGENGPYYVWIKTDGVDHMMFSLAYMVLALKLRMRGAWSGKPVMPFLRTFRQGRPNVPHHPII